MARAKGHFIYLLTCADGTLYTGYTTDVGRRLATHNAGRGAKYTRSRRPVVLAAQWEFPTQREALQAEFRVRHLPRQAKLALIALLPAELP